MDSRRRLIVNAGAQFLYVQLFPMDGISRAARQQDRAVHPH